MTALAASVTREPVASSIGSRVAGLFVSHSSPLRGPGAGPRRGIRHVPGVARLLLALAVTTLLPIPLRAEALLPWSGSAVTDIALTTLDGGSETIRPARGRVTIIHFFATWCDPCRPEMSALQRLADRAGDRIEIVAISVAEPASRVRKLAELLALRLPLRLDEGRALARGWPVEILPSSFVFDADARPRLTIAGPYSWDEFAPDALSGESETPRHEAEGGRQK